LKDKNIKNTSLRSAKTEKTGWSPVAHNYQKIDSKNYKKKRCGRDGSDAVSHHRVIEWSSEITSES
jgi:hypothetical protein